MITNFSHRIIFDSILINYFMHKTTCPHKVIFALLFLSCWQHLQFLSNIHFIFAKEMHSAHVFITFIFAHLLDENYKYRVSLLLFFLVLKELHYNLYLLLCVRHYRNKFHTIPLKIVGFFLLYFFTQI